MRALRKFTEFKLYDSILQRYLPRPLYGSTDQNFHRILMIFFSNMFTETMISSVCKHQGTVHPEKV